MSTILDAIRKAEKQRIDDSVPSLEAMVQQKRRRSGGRPWLLWTLVGLVLLALLAVAYVYRGPLHHFSLRAIESIKFRTSHYFEQVASEPEQTEPVPVTLSQRQRQALDALKISVISFSKDANKRFAMIDAQIVREGDKLLNYPVIQIRRDGVLIGVDDGSVLLRP